MKEEMIHLIELAMTDIRKFYEIEEIYILYDQLQYSENLDDMAKTLIAWLFDKYEIEDVDFSLFNLKSEASTKVLKKGKEFYLDEECSFYFIINTHTELNAVISFFVKNKKQYAKILEDTDFINAAFFQISPIIQNGIMKKQHIESCSIDSVTNVYNRKYLITHIQKRIALSYQEKKHISFLMIGIDRFKAIIEEFDYDIADKVLIELAKVIHKEIKEFDIVARVIGDEFLVALVDLQSPTEAITVANRIVKEFAQRKIVVDELNKHVLQKTVCVGISSFPEDSQNINQVLKNADNFLAQAKIKGRGKVAVYFKSKKSSIDLF